MTWMAQASYNLEFVLPGDVTVIAGSGRPWNQECLPGLHAGGWKPWPPPACAKKKVDMELGLSPRLVGEAGQADAENRARGLYRPVRLVGSTSLVDRGTGEDRPGYSSSSELDGITYLRCGNRRAAVCPSCSAEFKGDAWHLLMCGLAGGKGIPASVATHPCTFATLTAPSFGPVHGLGQKGPCRARRDRPVCPHGRPAWCTRRHTDDDGLLGQPLCADCYDYLAHVVWQWHAPELWRRFCIALQRDLAAPVAASSRASSPKRSGTAPSSTILFGRSTGSSPGRGDNLER
jgi:hypothetical protein